MEYLTDEMGKKLVAHLNMTDAFSAAVEEEESKNAPDKRKADWELELEVVVQYNFVYCFTNVLSFFCGHYVMQM